jgi:CDP-diglyceride synthetase
MYAVWVSTLLLAAAAIFGVQSYLRAKEKPLSLRRMAILLAVPTIGVLSAIPLRDSGLRFEVSVNTIPWLVFALWPYLLCLAVSFRIEFQGVRGSWTIWAYASLSFITLATAAWASLLSFAS